MRPPSMLRRFALICLALVQIGAPVAASVGDALLLVRNDRVASRAHIEDHTRRACVSVDPDDCALCQFLSHLGATPAPAVTLPSAQRETTCVRHAGVVLARVGAPRNARSRAPPLA